MSHSRRRKLTHFVVSSTSFQSSRKSLLSVSPASVEEVLTVRTMVKPQPKSRPKSPVKEDVDDDPVKGDDLGGFLCAEKKLHFLRANIQDLQDDAENCEEALEERALAFKDLATQQTTLQDTIAENGALAAVLEQLPTELRTTKEERQRKFRSLADLRQSLQDKREGKVRDHCEIETGHEEFMRLAAEIEKDDKEVQAR